MAIGANMMRQLQGRSPGWTGPVTETLDTGTLDNDAAHIFDSPARLVWCVADGNLDFTVWGDDTADGTTKCTRAMKAGDIIREFAISKIWASSTGAFKAFR